MHVCSFKLYDEGTHWMQSCELLDARCDYYMVADNNMKFSRVTISSSHAQTISYHTYDCNIHLSSLALFVSIEHTIRKKNRWAFRRFTVAILPKINGNKLLHKFPFATDSSRLFVRCWHSFHFRFWYSSRSTRETLYPLGRKVGVHSLCHFVEHLFNGEQRATFTPIAGDRKRRMFNYDNHIKIHRLLITSHLLLIHCNWCPSYYWNPFK